MFCIIIIIILEAEVIKEKVKPTPEKKGEFMLIFLSRQIRKIIFQISFTITTLPFQRLKSRRGQNQLLQRKVWMSINAFV